jgi:LacI family transcriptional regulator
MSITIRKIAKDLKLAVSTVSKALRDSHEISAATKAKVFAYAAELDYAPNPYASSLKRRRSGNIAVVLPEVADSFFSAAINGIEEVAQQQGYHVMVYLTHEDVKKEQSIVRDFLNGRVDGVLISIASNAENYNHLTDLSSRQVPLVFFDRICEEINTPSIITNDEECGYNATRHLLERGCRNIAFLSLFNDLPIIRNRMTGYQKALTEAHINSAKGSTLFLTNDELLNKVQIKKMLEEGRRPDGIIGSVEKVTMQAYDVCREMGLRIPTDVKIIGFSHLQIAHLLSPSLTTITQPAFEMGKMAASILFRKLENKTSSLQNEKIVIPSLLIERESTK